MQSFIGLTTDNNNSSSIFFSHGGPPYNTQVLVANETHSYSCRATGNTIVTATLYTFVFSLNAANVLEIRQDGAQTALCTASVQLPDVHRENKWLGESPFYEENAAAVPLQGAITSLMVKNGDNPAFNPRTDFVFKNFGGQPFGGGLVASFYARFDDTLSRRWQRAFDLGNPGGEEIIWCGQRDGTQDMTCGYKEKDAGASQRINAKNFIIYGDFAFWHFGLDAATGNMWIQKNGATVATATKNIDYVNVFRRVLLIAESPFNNHDLAGVVLGLRIDRNTGTIS